MMDTKPSKQMTGATLMRRTLKMSGSKCVGEDEGPVINTKPTITTAMPTASRMKLVLSKANFSLFTLLMIND